MKHAYITGSAVARCLRSAPFCVATLGAAALALQGCSSDVEPAHSSPSTSSGAGTGAGGGGGGVGNGGSGGSGEAAPIGGDRPVEVVVPSSYKEGTALPLIIVLHGYSGFGAFYDFYFGLKPLA